MTTVIMVNIYGLSRIFYVIARDRLLPKVLSKLHPKYDSPHITIILFTILIALMGAFLPYSSLAELASMAALTDYIIVAIVVILFRLRMPNAERPFKCPAVFIIAPIALLVSLYLLFKQIIGVNGEFLISGKVYFLWFFIAFILYLLRGALIKTRNLLEKN
jgi:APA family basic amino acid/polyamine antiporter